MSSESLKSLWSDSDWESELKKDDERIAAYMHELPSYIDLPAEDAIIMKHIERKAGSPLEDSVVYSVIDRDDDEFDDFDESDDVEDWAKRDGAKPYMAFSELARKWAQEFAMSPSPAPQREFLRISCLYGKLMARCCDIIDVDEQEYPALRSAFAKRILSTINDLLGEFKKIRANFPAHAATADSHFEKLVETRDSVLDLLETFHTGK